MFPPYEFFFLYRDGTLDQDRNAAEYHCPDVYDHLDSSRTRFDFQLHLLTLIKEVLI